MNNLYIIAGSNGSGKTTASYNMLPELLNCSEFVNSDEFAKCISPFSPGKASIQASRYMLLKIRWLFERRKDFAIETTLATRSLKKMILEAQNSGYKITLLYFWIDNPELSIARVKARVSAGGHNISEETVRRRYYLGLRYLFDEYMPLVDRWILADNSNIPFRVVAQGWKNGNTSIVEEEKYNEILRTAQEAENI